MSHVWLGLAQKVEALLPDDRIANSGRSNTLPGIPL